MAHTKGPWIASCDGMHSTLIRKVLVSPKNHSELGDAAADAHLIAAAPDLYEACQEAYGVLTEPGMMDVDEWKVWQKRTIAMLDAAITKAKGR